MYDGTGALAVHMTPLLFIISPSCWQMLALMHRLPLTLPRSILISQDLL